MCERKNKITESVIHRKSPDARLFRNAATSMAGTLQAKCGAVCEEIPFCFLFVCFEQFRNKNKTEKYSETLLQVWLGLLRHNAEQFAKKFPKRPQKWTETAENVRNSQKRPKRRTIFPAAIAATAKSAAAARPFFGGGAEVVEGTPIPNGWYRSVLGCRKVF